MSQVQSELYTYGRIQETDDDLDTLPFKQWMSTVQRRVEIDLDVFLPSEQMLPQRLHAAMRYATLGGGKRVRALLVYAAGSLFGAIPEDMARAACALEMKTEMIMFNR